jgi:hypothetical protein
MIASIGLNCHSGPAEFVPHCVLDHLNYKGHVSSCFGWSRGVDRIGAGVCVLARGRRSSAVIVCHLRR